MVVIFWKIFTVVIFQKRINRKKAKRAAHNQLTISKSTAGSNLTDKKENRQPN